MTTRELIILGCSSQQPTRKRNHGAYLVRWNGEGLLFDPGEGTQRQCIFANVPPTCITRILISHFHGDHCAGLGSMLMRLNLDKVTHPIHCYYPASGKVYFDRLRYGTSYYPIIQVIEHPIAQAGIVENTERFCIAATFLDHGIDTLGYRITEPNRRKFDPSLLATYGIRGIAVRRLEEMGVLDINGKQVTLDDVSVVKRGLVFAYVMDTLPCQGAIEIAKGADLLLCESTYLARDSAIAKTHHHLTALQAAEIALLAEVKELVLTHFSARYQDLEEFLQEARTIFPRTHVADDLKRFSF